MLVSRIILLVLVVLVLARPPVLAQQEGEGASRQLWLNYILGFPKSPKLYHEVDFEGAAEVEGVGPWRYLYATNMVEYYPSRWVDLTGELVTGYTRQTAEEDSIELALRLGVRLHLLSTILSHYKPERIPGTRLSIANLARFEQRNFWYTGDRPSSHEWRFRDRIEFRLAFNHKSMAIDRTWYGMADAEWFVPLTNDVPERFAAKFRVRAGFGYRHNYKWRFEILAQRDDARDTLNEEFDVEAYMLDLRVKTFF